MITPGTVSDESLLDENHDNALVAVSGTQTFANKKLFSNMESLT